MKNLRVLTLLLIVALVAVFEACKPGEDPPVLILSGGTEYVSSNTTITDTNAVVSHSLHFKGSCTKGSKDLESFKITVSYDNAAPQTISSHAKFSGALKDIYNFDTVVTTRSVAGKEKYTFTITDKDGKTDSETIEITLVLHTDTVIPVNKPNYVTGLALTNSLGFIFTGASNPSVLDQTQSDAQKTDVDLTYYYSTNFDKHSFISPYVRSDAGIYSAPVLLDGYTVNTEFRTLASSVDLAAYADSAESALEAIFDSGTSSVYTGNPNGARIEVSNNTVFAFKAGTRYGLIHVNNVVTNTEGCSINLLVQDN